MLKLKPWPAAKPDMMHFEFIIAGNESADNDASQAACLSQWSCQTQRASGLNPLNML